MSLESDFQSDLIKRLNIMIGDKGFVFPKDGNYIQGFPDVLILYKNRWAALECKRSPNEPFQPNQEFYIDMINGLSFAACIYPENEEEVLHDLQQALRIRQPRISSSRISKRE
jgi:hypothetical protein